MYNARVLQGEHTIIILGYANRNQNTTLYKRELKCIEEVEFGTSADGNVTCVPVVESSCNNTEGNRPDSSNNGGVSSMRRSTFSDYTLAPPNALSLNSMNRDLGLLPFLFYFCFLSI